MKRLFLFFGTLFALLLFISCGGVNSTQDSNETIKGVVYDDIVVGLEYKTKDFHAKTNQLGEFNYKSGEIKFYLNKLLLGTVPAMPNDRRVFLSDILNLPRGEYKDTKLIKLATLIQSLDTKETKTAITLDQAKIQTLFTKPNENFSSLDISTLDINLVNQEKAMQRVKDTLIAQGIKPKEDPTPQPEPTPKPINKAPIANAGSDKTIEFPQIFTLDASNSTDEAKDTLLYEWYLNGTKISQSKTHTITPTKLGTFIYTLKVTDTQNLSDTDTITITIQDTTNPTIKHINPKNNQKDVPTDRNITITFSEELHASTITKENIHVNHNLSYDIKTDDNKTIKLIPTNKFDENQTYTLTIKNIQDKSGNTLQDKNITTFTTADETKPTIKDINIENNETNIPTDTNITITFSEELNASTITEANIHVNHNFDYNLTIKDNKTILLTHTKNFDENQTYILTIKDIQDKSGNTFQDTNTTTFTTADETNPTITDINIENNETNVPTDRNITITFSEELNASTITKENIHVNHNFDYNLTIKDNKTIKLIPTNKFDENQTYILTIKDIQDKSGNTLQDTTKSFTTADETKPTIKKINIENNEINIPTDTNITITFSEELNASTITEDNIHVNPTINYTLSIDDNKTIKLIPTNKFDENQTYTITIKNIQDKSGNTLQDTTKSFTTADETAPTITEINIENNQTNIPTDTNITITFSEELNASTITKKNIHVNQSLSYDIKTDDNKTITITPTNKFDENQTYTLTIQNIQDKSGNTLQDTNTTTFTTADETAPTIKDINLQKDTTNLHVSIHETFNISFSEELNALTKTDNFTLIKGTTPIDINFTKNNENNVTIKPTNNLDFNTTYTLHVNNIKDPSGNTLTEQTYTFKTQERYYISEDANGTGTTWQDALNISNIQKAIDNSEDKNISIWFKEGTYKPNATIDIKNSVKLYGGFEGNETNLDQRVLTKENNTTLSGDNNKRVLSTNHVNEYTILDGFYVVEGKVEYPENGAGMNNNDSNITISNVTFSANNASYGGGMSNKNSNPTLTNVTFSKNASDTAGGGMYNEHNSHPTLTNVTFSENRSSFGGGMYNYYSNPTLTNVTFSGNSAIGIGGGGLGGGMSNNRSNPTLTNVTFSENSVNHNGGGMSNFKLNPTLTNTIIWSNTATEEGANIYNDQSTPTITHSIIKDLNLTNTNYKDKNNSTEDPLLTKKQKTINGVTHTYYELGSKSSALNKGKDEATTKTTDQLGNPRVENSQIDIGAIEMPESNPYIINITPQNNEANVSLDTNITITFSEPMDKDTLIPDNFKLVDDTNTTITLNETMFTFNETNSTLTINPDENLTANKIYTLTIKKEITDKNENALEEIPRRFSTSSAPLPRFTRDDTNKIVTDWQENRMWQDNEAAKTVRKNWDNAKKYCKDLTFGGYSDWYLPTKDELMSIVDTSRNPSINSVFKNALAEWYWSSTEYFSSTYYAGRVDFYSGSGGWNAKSYTYYVRCVR